MAKPDLDLPTRTCESCGHDYDPNKFGAGTRYCSMLCKHTEGGSRPISNTNKPGRPRAYPTLTQATQLLIKEKLRDLGFELAPTVRPGVILLTRHSLSHRACLGWQPQPSRKFADSLLFIDRDYLYATSLCTKEVNYYTTRNRKQSVRRACQRTACNRCASARWLNQLLIDLQRPTL